MTHGYVCARLCRKGLMWLCDVKVLGVVNRARSAAFRDCGPFAGPLTFLDKA